MRFVKFRLGWGERVSSFLLAVALEVDGGASRFFWISEAWASSRLFLGTWMLTLGMALGSCFQLAGRQTRSRSSSAYGVHSTSTYCGELSLWSGALHKIKCLDIYRGCSD